MNKQYLENKYNQALIPFLKNSSLENEKNEKCKEYTKEFKLNFFMYTQINNQNFSKMLFFREICTNEYILPNISFWNKVYKNFVIKKYTNQEYITPTSIINLQEEIKINKNSMKKKIKSDDRLKRKNQKKICCLQQIELIKKLKNSHASKINLKKFFIESIKSELSFYITDVNKNKNFDFVSLKILWSQFISGEPIAQSPSRKLSGFEKQVFSMYLKRAGYIPQPILISDDLKEITELQNDTFESKKSTKELLVFALKNIFKKLMFSFFYESDTSFFTCFKTIQLTALESKMFYEYYFGDVANEMSLNICNFYLTKEVLNDERSMLLYLEKMAKSDLMIIEINKYLNVNVLEEDESDLAKLKRKILQSDSYKKQKYEIANHIDKRVNNFEIVLNQFDESKQANEILRWMKIILNDIKFNPKFRIPWNLSDFLQSMIHLKECIKKKKLIE